jgi:hypothetical protein
LIVLPPSSPRWTENYDLGWIGFVHHRSLLADGITWLTRYWRAPRAPSVSHVFIVSGPSMCIEANGDGVDEDSLDQYFRDPKYTVYLRKPRSWTLDLGGLIVTAARKYKGLPYDFKLLTADALSYSLIGHLVNELRHNEMDAYLTKLADNPRQMICDKLAAVAMRKQPELARLGTMRLPARENNPQRLFCDDALFYYNVTTIVGSAPKSVVRSQWSWSVVSGPWSVVSGPSFPLSAFSFPL